MRLLITGVPGSGKTTLARALVATLPGAWRIIHTDNYKHLAWSEQPGAILRDLAIAEQHKRANGQPCHVMLEGVGAVRVLTPGTEGTREVWAPDRILCCLRADGLLAPTHKGIAGLIKARLGDWQGPITTIQDARIAVESLQNALALLGEMQLHLGE